MRARWALAVVSALLALAVLLAGGRGGGGEGPGDGAGPAASTGGPKAGGEAEGASPGAPQVYESELPLEEEGARLLEGYRERGDCVLVRDGYLDLTGSTWGCVTQGEGWVEICIVRDGGDGGCSVATLHMDAEDVAAAVGAAAGT